MTDAEELAGTEASFKALTSTKKIIDEAFFIGASTEEVAAVRQFVQALLQGQQARLNELKGVSNDVQSATA